MGDQYREALSQSETIKQIVTNQFNEVAKEKGILCCKVATVASINGNNVTVYFPGDNENQSASYPNKTGQSLSVGQKVYIYHKYGDIEQGWIFVN